MLLTGLNIDSAGDCRDIRTATPGHSSRDRGFLDPGDHHSFGISRERRFDVQELAGVHAS